jgi:hypothetical protein
MNAVVVVLAIIVRIKSPGDMPSGHGETITAH